MKQITLAEYNKIHSDRRSVWTTERDDLPDWAEKRHLYMGKRTMMSGDGTCSLLIEGLSFEIIDDTPQTRIPYTIDNSGLCDRIYQGHECVAEVVNGSRAKELIDAANATPDLLEALRECITEGGAACMNTGQKSRRLDAISRIARNAISKATGETP